MTARALALAILCALPALPAIVTYSDPAAWQMVTRLEAIENFNSFTPVDTSFESIGPLSGLTFSSPAYYEVLVTDESGGTPWGTGRYLRATYAFTSLRVDFPAVTAFAALMMIDNGASGSNMTVTVRDGTSTRFSKVLPTAPKPTPAFFGVVSTDSNMKFNSVTFTPHNNAARLDDVQLGTWVPEPGAGWLALGGLGVMAVGCGRKGRMNPAPPVRS